MNQLTSQQRKLIYLAGMGILLIPIIWLGFPASSAKKQVGGRLAQLRQQYDLGESTLGNVDPSSATMNLVLLGLRGPAACLLWVQLDEQKDAKDWAAMRATTDSITMLQPHFQKVWQFHGWNLAYNVSVEWDAVKDRYFWVKEGAKFMKKGITRNAKYPELYWYYGDTIGKKIGRADEWRQFREFFRVDPDKKTYTVNEIPGPDREINPHDRDNYEEAAEWFELANNVMDTYKNEQHIMDKSLFRSYPGRAKIEQASTRQKVGQFDERTREIWADAFRYWTTRYGRENWYPNPGIEIHLEWSPKEITKYAENAVIPPEFKGTRKEYEVELRRWVNRYQDMTNYRYWRDKCYSEQQTVTMEAHRELHAALDAYVKGDTFEAERLALSGLTKYAEIFKDEISGIGLKDDDLAIEEGMLGIMTWRESLKLNGKAIPNDFPLRDFWFAHQNRMNSIEPEFRRRISPTE